MKPSPDAWAEVGRRIRDARERRGMTQPDLAARAGVSPTTVSKIETATRTNYQRAKVRAIWRALDLNAGELDGILSGETAVQRDAVTAVLADPLLSRRDKQMLLDMYYRFTRPGDADTEDE